MRDFKIITPLAPDENWVLDLDFIDGVPAYVPEDRNTQDQRAAISAYIMKGTIPGKPNVGVDWPALYKQDATILDVDNQIKQNIQKNAAIPSIPSSSYMPVYKTDKDGIHVGIMQTQ